MKKFLERHKLWRRIHEEIENLNRSITCEDFEVVVYKIPQKESLSAGGYTDEFYKNLKKN